MECPHCGKEITQAAIDKEWEELNEWGRKLVAAYQKFSENKKLFAELEAQMPEAEAAIERIYLREIEVAQLHARVITGYPAMWSKN